MKLEMLFKRMPKLLSRTLNRTLKKSTTISKKPETLSNKVLIMQSMKSKRMLMNSLTMLKR